MKEYKIFIIKESDDLIKDILMISRNYCDQQFCGEIEYKFNKVKYGKNTLHKQSCKILDIQLDYINNNFFKNKECRFNIDSKGYLVYKSISRELMIRINYEKKELIIFTLDNNEKQFIWYLDYYGFKNKYKELSDRLTFEEVLKLLDEYDISNSLTYYGK